VTFLLDAGWRLNWFSGNAILVAPMKLFYENECTKPKNVPPSLGLHWPPHLRKGGGATEGIILIKPRPKHVRLFTMTCPEPKCVQLTITGGL